jgi:hypothetical protein
MRRPRLQQHVLVSVLALLVYVCWALVALPQTKSQEYRVEATYLSNFGKFVGWPASTSKEPSFLICVLGSDPFGTMLDVAVSGEKIHNQSVMTERITTAEDASVCRIVFISSSEAPNLMGILGVLDSNSILTVSDMPDFLARGGMIQFVLTKGKVRFEVNIAATNSAKLTLSSQLLKVAASVRRDAQPPGENPQ